jgi:flagellar biosynthetic protein FliP
VGAARRSIADLFGVGSRDVAGPPPPGRSTTTLPRRGRETIFSSPTAAELKRAALLSLFTTLVCLAWPIAALAQEAAQSGSAINIDLGSGAGLTQRVVQLIGLMTVLSLAPSIVIMTTSFVRIVVVLSLLRTALGLQQSPPNAVLVSLALFLSAIVMAPTWQDAYDSGVRPLLDQQMELPQAFDAASEPVKTFMLSQVDQSDLALFTRLSRLDTPQNLQDLPLRVVTPAFMISELKTAFEIGFLLFVPFLVIDLVVASVLMSMGMMMLPPVVVSLPFKLIFFVLVDGWRLVAGSLVESFQRGAGGG